MKLFPNPYLHIDHKSRLAGSCPVGEGVRLPSEMPKRESAGAKREVVSYQPAEINSINGQAVGVTPSKTESRFCWSCEPFEVEDNLVSAYWHQRLTSGEVFKVIGDGLVQLLDRGPSPVTASLLDALALARMKAFADYQAAYLKEPDTSTWATQFEIDEQVAKRMGELLEKARAKQAELAQGEANKPAPAAQKRFPLEPENGGEEVGK